MTFYRRDGEHGVKKNHAKGTKKKRKRKKKEEDITPRHKGTKTSKKSGR